MKPQVKRFALATAALMLAAPFATTAASADPYNGYGRGDYQNSYGQNSNGHNSYGQRDHNNRGYQGDRGWNNQYQGNYRSGYQGNYGWNNGERNWRRGDRLSDYDQSRFRDFDYRREHFRDPPRGYRYVRDDRGDTLLVGVLSGVVLSAILNNGDRY
jgi:Ni/Co efflux regulator RcnB